MASKFTTLEINAAIKFATLNEKMDALIEEHGFYKTANIFASAYELDQITESQGCSLRFILAAKYERAIRKCGDHLLGIETLDLETPLCESPERARNNRLRTYLCFDNSVNGMGAI